MKPIRIRLDLDKECYSKISSEDVAKFGQRLRDWTKKTDEEFIRKQVVSLEIAKKLYVK